MGLQKYYRELLNGPEIKYGNKQQKCLRIFVKVIFVKCKITRWRTYENFLCLLQYEGPVEMGK